jgi:hypothetical protein
MTKEIKTDEEKQIDQLSSELYREIIKSNEMRLNFSRKMKNEVSVLSFVTETELVGIICIVSVCTFIHHCLIA